MICSFLFDLIEHSYNPFVRRALKWQNLVVIYISCINADLVFGVSTTFTSSHVMDRW